MKDINGSAATDTGRTCPNIGTGAAFKSGMDEWRQGWRALVAASLGASVGWHIFMASAGLFIIPMQEYFGWSRAAISIAPIIGLGSAFLNPLTGALIDRVGPRSVAIVGLLSLAVALILLAMTPRNAVYFYAVATLIAISGSMTNTMVFTKGVGSWFRQNIGLALGTMMFGFSAISALTLPFLADLISRYGWRSGYIGMVAAITVVGLPVTLLWFREPPAEKLQKSDSEHASSKSVRLAMRDRRFWILVAFLGCASPAVGGFVSQLQPLLVSSGFSQSFSARLVVVYAVAVALGRISVGVMLDLARPSLVAASCMGLAAVGAFILGFLAGPDAWGFTCLAVVLIGLANGAEGDFLAFFTLRFFGLNSYAALYGALAIVMGAGVSVGGILFAAIYDYFGSYHIAVYSSIMALGCASVVALLLRSEAAGRPMH